MNAQSNIKLSGPQAGVTLIELMIVVVIVAILGSFAIPSYTEYVTRAKRQGASQVLLTIASKQEQYFLDNKTYSSSLANLGYSAATIATDDDGQQVSTGDGSAQYSFAISASTNTSSGVVISYTATATPLNTQLSRDTRCGALSVDESGERKAGGSVSPDCW